MTIIYPVGLTEDQWKVLVTCVAEAPYRVAAPIIDQIRMQIGKAQADTAAAAAAAAADTAKADAAAPVPIEPAAPANTDEPTASADPAA